MSRDDGHFRLRIPNDVKRWVKASAEQNMRSITAEIIFTLKEKMEKAAGDEIGVMAPAAHINQGSGSSSDE
ncbi:Arc family DNA-binding protein [Devosia sp.]|uniref:Arc family DNA-binding protein n=1 Tax=Devosia sp. TaxID=1871048 RepID=UPI002B0002C1|nr:Arc family DNA-binding protein [Devosia sp.]